MIQQVASTSGFAIAYTVHLQLILSLPILILQVALTIPSSHPLLLSVSRPSPSMASKTAAAAPLPHTPQRRRRHQPNRTRLCGRKADAPQVRLSKTLAYALRHGAEALKLDMRPSGFVSLSQLLALPLFQSFSEQQVEQVVQTDAKKRFSMTTTEFELDKVFVRANQGHTLPFVQDEELLRPLEDPRDVEMCVHGTYLKFWDSIWNSGLCKMQRNHIHFAETDVLDDDAIVSGIRANCNLFVYIDVAMAMKEGIKFYKSSNNVVLSPGGKDTGVIDRRYFLRAVKRDGTVVYARDESVERSE